VVWKEEEEVIDVDDDQKMDEIIRCLRSAARIKGTLSRDSGCLQTVLILLIRFDPVQKDAKIFLH
jgi:hypothetical protein